MGREETSPMRLPLEDVTVIDLNHAPPGNALQALRTKTPWA